MLKPGDRSTAAQRFESTEAVRDSAAPRLGEWLGEAVTLFGRAWPVWLAQGAICYLVVAPLVLGLGFYYASVLFREYNEALSGYGMDPLSGVRAIWNAAGFACAGLVPVALISTFFIGGMARTAVRQLRGDPVSLQDMFTAGDVYLPSLGAAAIAAAASIISVLFLVIPVWMLGNGQPLGTALITALALLPLVAPGMLLATRFLLLHPLVAEGKRPFRRGLRESWRITGGHPGLYLVWTLLLYLTAGAGMVVIVGTVVTLPLAVLMLMVGYRDAVGLDDG